SPDRRPERPERRACKQQPDEQQRQPLPGLAARHAADLDRGAEEDRQREAKREGDGRGERDLRGDELAQSDETARKATDRVLVPLGRERARGEDEREEADRQ